MTDSTFRDEIALIVDNLAARGWTQGTMKNANGEVCAHGAVQTCKGLRPGDEWIVRAVMRAKGLTEVWNDKFGRTMDDVVEKLSQIEVSDSDLEVTFGPSWEKVIAVIRRIATLTDGEAKEMARAWGPAENAACEEALDAALAAARASDTFPARYAASDTAYEYANSNTRSAVHRAVHDAACAVSVSDLVGQHGLTQKHIDTLMAPWVRAFGDNWEQDRTVAAATPCACSVQRARADKAEAEVERLRPKVIGSVEELDALPEDSVVRDDSRYVYEKVTGSRWHQPGFQSYRWSDEIDLPARVMWTPGADDE